MRLRRPRKINEWQYAIPYVIVSILLPLFKFILAVKILCKWRKREGAVNDKRTSY